MTAEPRHPDLHELVDQLNVSQADEVRAVVLRLVAPSEPPADDVDGKDKSRRLSFAGTLSAEPDFADRSESILAEIVERHAR